MDLTAGFQRMKKTWFLLGLWLFSVAAKAASELDIYLGEPQPVPARIMLLVDTSLSMNDPLCDADGSNCQAKIAVLRNTLQRFLIPEANGANASMLWPDDYEIGLARYNEPGARILAEIRPLGYVHSDGVTHRQRLAALVGALRVGGNTPLVGSYLETIEFLLGGVAISDGFEASVDVVKSAARPRCYIRGMSDQEICGVNNNHLVVLTDGMSHRERMDTEIYACDRQACDTTIGQRIQQRANHNNLDNYLPGCPANVETDMFRPTRPGNTQIWNCASALARSLITVDPQNSTIVSGIRTHTIAYDLGDGTCVDRIATPSSTVDYLCNWAKDGGGGSYTAKDRAGLESAFQSLIGNVRLSQSFSASVPGLSINQSSRFSYLNDVYYSVFKPSSLQVWYGNLKKYQLARENNVPFIADANGDDVDADHDGFFDEAVESFWFNPADYDPGIQNDGDNVLLGGAALRIPAKTSRKIYTSLGNTTELLDDDYAASVAAAMLPSTFASSEEERLVRAKIDNVVNWLRGDDVGNEWGRLVPGQATRVVRNLYGAPIHSSPVVVNYTSTQEVSNVRQPLAAEAQDNVVFVSTNDGKLYAVDAATGDEKLVFVPGAFLQRSADGGPSMVERYYDAVQNRLPGDFIYGLDSTWTVWRQDVDRDGNITSSNSNDFVYLFGGMRRGGRNYYGLDMTAANDDTPHMEQLFVLEGGVANSPTWNMGQTWSEPVLGLIKFNNVPVVVFFVGGGYDPVYDTGRPASGTVPMGAQIYIVAAHDRGNGINAGDVLWWASSAMSGPGNHQQVSALTDSIPSTIKVLDKDGDGYVDHLYVADLGGSLLRFDINNQNSGYRTLVSNTDSPVVAELGREAVEPLTAADRRFFFPPSVALMKDNLGKHVAIALGSGLLTNPRDTDTDEQFFFVKDYAPFGISVTRDNNPIFAYSLSEPAEKLLGSPLIIGGQAFFSTYYWGDNERTTDTDVCTPQYGRAALYRYNPAVGSILRDPRVFPQSLAGSLSTVMQTYPPVLDEDGQIITPGGTDFVGIGGTSAFDLPDVDLGNIRKTRWRECASSSCN